MNGTRTAVVPFAQETERSAGFDSWRTWRRLSLSAGACATLLDAILLQRKLGLFTGGFLAADQLGTWLDGLAFLMLSALLNVAVIAPLALVAMEVCRRLALRPLAVSVGVLGATAAPLAVADFVTYQIWSFLGDAFDFHVMYSLTGRRLSEFFAVTTPLMTRPLLLLATAFAGVSALTLAVHRWDKRPPTRLSVPTPRLALQRCLSLILVSSVAVTSVALTSDAMVYALRWTPSGQLFVTVMNRISDLDGDGYGLLRNPRDAAPLDPQIHPYAIDVPGNGIDENGLGGDLPQAARAPSSNAIPAAAWPQRPPVILFVLESVRADAIGAVFKGRRVTPVLDGLAAQGVKVESAWSHNGFTGQSRYHILTGTLASGAGSNTLLDDFKAHGYDVAYFSGQNDDFGRLGLQYEAAARYYDARHDIGQRYSSFTTPGSLAVPLRVVETRIGEYLKERQTRAPLFMYVNFHDTHYPYDHQGLEDILGVERLPVALISPSRRTELAGTYLNALANVDRAIGRVIAGVEANVGRRPVVVVIGDHGESLFDQGFLGHGYALNEAQTRIPLIVKGLPVRIETPFGQSDLRRALNDALSAGSTEERPVVKGSFSKRVFQYLGLVETPSQIGWVAAEGPIVYDFRSHRLTLWDGSIKVAALVGEPKRALLELIHNWERLLLAGRENGIGKRS